MSSSITWPCAALEHAELAPRTTMRVGGRVEWLLEPKDPDELREAVVAARERDIEPRILGGGANIVIEEGELPGVVIATERLRYTFRPTMDEDPSGEWTQRPSGAEPSDAPVLVAWAGSSLPGLVRTATELGWSGLECLAGVPGNVGGGVAMNAGGRYGEIGDVVELLRVVERDGSLADLDRAQWQPSYRNGRLEGRIVVGAVLRLEPENPLAVRERVREYLLEKRRNQPVTEWSAGCVFKNPDPELSDGRSAGLLVEESGGKELRRGDAIVSPLHGNFIVNVGSATAADVLTLIEDLRDRVAQRTGVVLQREVQVWRSAD